MSQITLIKIIPLKKKSDFHWAETQTLNLVVCWISLLQYFLSCCVSVRCWSWQCCCACCLQACVPTGRPGIQWNQWRMPLKPCSWLTTGWASHRLDSPLTLPSASSLWPLTFNMSMHFMVVISRQANRHYIMKTECRKLKIDLYQVLWTCWHAVLSQNLPAATSH